MDSPRWRPGTCSARSSSFADPRSPLGPASRVLDELVPSLICPVCRADLTMSQTGLCCAAGHSFDRARQGYVNLAAAVGKAALGADSAAAVAARVDFLTAGHFSFWVA